MQYATYYEEQQYISHEQYGQMKQAILNGGTEEKFEKFTLRKLRFSGTEGNDAVARYYLCIKNQDEEEIFLEKKYVQNHIYHKSCIKLGKEEAQRIIHGDLEWMKGSKEALLTDFYLQTTLNHLYASSITEYQREMVKCKDGYVTFFKKISSAGIEHDNFFGQFTSLINCLDEGKILVTYKKKVKMPSFVRDVVQGRETASEELIYAF